LGDSSEVEEPPNFLAVIDMIKNSTWDARYSGGTYVYGTAPNGFLAEVGDRIPRGRVLSLGEGEGRNAVYLASQGYDVTAVDASPVGLEKARRLASEHGVRMTTVVADLADFPFEPGRWDGIVSIFCHLPSALRARVYQRAVAGLRPGGAFILEAYTPRQLAFKTGGPSQPDMLVTLDALRSELAGLRLERAVELEREVVEGSGHHGRGAVVQVLGFKEAQ
jgi:SAM-dependent methyltransferase